MEDTARGSARTRAWAGGEPLAAAAAVLGDARASSPAAPAPSGGGGGPLKGAAAAPTLSPALRGSEARRAAAHEASPFVGRKAHTHGGPRRSPRTV